MRGVVEVNRVNHTGRKGARMQGKSFNSQKPSASPRVTESLRTGKPIRVQESGSNRQMESGKVVKTCCGSKLGGKWCCGKC